MERKLAFKGTCPLTLRATLPWLAAGIVYALALRLPIPPALGETIRHGFNFWLLAAMLILYLGFRLDKTTGWMISLLPVSLLFGIALAGLWVNVYSEMQVVSGMIYFSDAYQYYSDALRILNGFPLSTFSARHPLPTLFLAILLWVTGKNLMLALGILVFFCVVCIHQAAGKVQQMMGPAAAAGFTMVIFLFYRRFIGIVDSESLGLALGCLAFSFLVSRANHRESIELAGFALLGLGLAARPGAFLILPAILIWYVINNHDHSLLKLRRFLLGALILSSGFWLSQITNLLLAEPGSRIYSNLAYTLYGISQGGKGWEQFSEDYPSYASLPAVEAEAFAYQQTFRSITTHPEAALQGMASSFRGYFSIQDNSLFGFLCSGEITAFNGRASPTEQTLFQGARLIAWGLLAVGMIAFWEKKRMNPVCIPILLGWLFSLLLVPSEDAGIMRVFATTIPFLAGMVSLGWYALNKGLAKLVKTESTTDPKSPRWVKSVEPTAAREKLPLPWQTGCALGIVFLFLGSAFLTRIRWDHLRRPPQPACLVGKAGMVIEVNRGSFITLVSKEGEARFPQVRQADYLASIASLRRTEIVEPLSSLPGGSTVLNTIDLAQGLAFWAVLPPQAASLAGSRLSICGHWHPGFQKIGLGFLMVDELAEPDEDMLRSRYGKIYP